MDLSRRVVPVLYVPGTECKQTSYVNACGGSVWDACAGIGYGPKPYCTGERKLAPDGQTAATPINPRDVWV